MKTAIGLILVSAALTVSSVPGDVPQGQVWQADVQIRTLEVTRTKSTITARIVVYTEKDDEARESRLVVLLPLGVGIDKLAPGCSATAGPSMVPSLRAAVECELGTIPDRGIREVIVTTTVPPDAISKRFGVFVYSNTPDPAPGNNYAERTIQ